MKHDRFFGLMLVGIVLAAAFPVAGAHADDPLDAFPTAEKTVEQRVKGLSDAERQAIRLPEKGTDLVFSIAMVPTSNGPGDAATKAEPWLRVFADGRINCGSSMPLPVARRDDTLTKAELAWLLHLAVDECQILSRTTKDIEENFQRSRSARPVPGDPQQAFQYRVELPSGTNELLIPEKALMVRPLRASLQLGAFASLNKYANYLAARAHLGDARQRQSLLDQLNGKLKTEQPQVPAFRMEHLGGALNIQTVDLTAAFEQEIELEPGKFKRVTGSILRKEKGAPPIFSVRAMEYAKLRP